jgi:hypothetical protein
VLLLFFGFFLLDSASSSVAAALLEEARAARSAGVIEVSILAPFSLIFFGNKECVVGIGIREDSYQNQRSKIDAKLETSSSR